MKEAVSMYLGGFVVKADDCDHDSAKQWGLKCPFCDSAVFLRSQSIRKIKGEDKVFGAYFSHYPCGNSEDLLCEERSISKQGRAELERIQVERRNQRLKVYNSHLWQIISEDLKFKNIYFAEVRKMFGGDKWLEQKAIEVRKSFSLEPEKSFQALDCLLKDFYNLQKFELLSNDFDLGLQRRIVFEVFGFLCTNSAGYVFLKVFKAAMLSVHHALPQSKGLYTAKNVTPVFFWVPVFFLVCSVNWRKQLAKYLPES